MSSTDTPAGSNRPGTTASAERQTTRALKPIDAKLFDDVQLELDVHLGKATMSMGAVRALKLNTILPLDIRLDEYATVRFKGAVIARGEIVAVDDRFALRITEIAPVDLA